ncbi:MAG: EAL domain-containing protein [Eubacterium sp.]|nr:EAL domain-containing protein [Eubacterium sp.]
MLQKEELLREGKENMYWGGEKMHQTAMGDKNTKERVKEIAVEHFNSFYVQRNMTNTLEYVSPDIHWIGSREYFVAYNKDGFRTLLQKELEQVPEGCVMKVVSSGILQVDEGCYSVNGVLELRIPKEEKMKYVYLCFTMVIGAEKGQYSIVSIHTSFQRKVSAGNAMIEEEWPIHHMAEDMKHDSQYDTLTGLYNIDSFKVEVRKSLEVEETSFLALICTNVSHFERVNNLYGMKRADRILTELANMITTCSLKVKVSCRSVADHFLALVAYEEEAELVGTLSRLCDTFKKKMKSRYPDARPRLGIGVYRITDRGEEVGRMVECANIARKSLRFQKRINIAFYDANVFFRMERVKKIERSMKKAMGNKEFKVYLQPKYNLETGEIVGAEALSRWVHEDGTVEYPDEFIPIFEKNGFIVELDFYMMEAVCDMIKRRLDAGKTCVPISINQSRVLLNNEEYPNRFAKMLKRYSIPPEYLELELTERIFKEDLSEMARIMGELKELGIRWSIDDFGTGYSSLNLLKELPVDIIKIDKSFLDETETSETSKIIIRKTVELTQELSKSVVCEGVETESQADYLRGIQCDVAQGYLYARPMPMIEFEQLLDEEMGD